MTNKNFHIVLAAIVIYLSLLSCSDLKIGVGLKGAIVDDEKMTLDGDTFDIRERIGDSLLIVWNYTNLDDRTPYYLLKYERNGFYYPLIGASNITSIDNTTDYVSLDDKEIYDIKNKKVLFSPPCSATGLYYLGKWNNLRLFASSDTICFSDGKCIGLQEDVFCRKPKDEDMVILVAGAQTIDVSFSDLYYAKKEDKENDVSVERLIKDYHIKTRNKYERMDAGFSVDLEISKDTTEADKAIREWMMAAIRDDAFYQLENNRDIPVGKCTSSNDMLHSLDEYGVLWEKLCRAEFQIEDTLEVRMTCDIRVRKVAIVMTTLPTIIEQACTMVDFTIYLMNIISLTTREEVECWMSAIL